MSQPVAKQFLRFSLCVLWAVMAGAAVAAPKNATVPGAPEAPTAYTYNGRIYVEAREPQDTGGSPITRYEFQTTSGEGGMVDAYFPRVYINGLVNGRTYQVTVRARNAVGLGPPSPVSNAVVPLANAPLLLPPEASVVEGDAGETTLQVTFELDRPAVVPVQFSVRSSGDPGTGGFATPGVDYAPVPLTPVRVEVGQTQVTLPVTVLGDAEEELDEEIVFYWDHGMSGAVRQATYDRSFRARILDDDGQAAAEIALRDDRLVLRENSPATVVPVLENDEFVTARLAGGSLQVVQAPSRGVAVVDTAGTPDDAADDILRYEPAAKTAGEDRLRYRLCLSGGVCREATVFVLVRPRPGLDLFSRHASGFEDVEVSGLRAMPSATFTTTALVGPESIFDTVPQDSTRFSPWDNAEGRRIDLRTLPAHTGDAPREWKVLVDAGDPNAGTTLETGTTADLYLGIDDNGDGQASEDELRCVAATNASVERCELAISQAPGERPAYWVMVHNRGVPPVAVRIDIYAVPPSGGTGSLVATGPGSAAAGEATPIRVSWQDGTLLAGGFRVGYVGLLADDGQPMGSFPIRVKRFYEEDEAVLLRNGEPYTLALRPGQEHASLFIDVPVGASAMTVQTNSVQNVDLFLSPAPDAGGGPDSQVEPVSGPATHAATGPTGNESIEVTGAALTPGRWYVVPRNAGTAAARVEVTASIDANAPAVRAGSYFNADRSGHGLFLYPASGQWVGLWYTYLEDGVGTWYYLQAPAPGIDGLWTSPIYRASWNGSDNGLTAIGYATLAPTDDRSFLFSYTLDGQTGSEPMSALGRGCPSLGGQPVDANSHWFNPATAGTGYSVQLFDNYEFHAAFIYDERGRPRFVTAERGSFGGETADLTAQQLKGFCPTCPRLAPPERFDVGVLGRTISQGQLERMSLDVLFEAGVEGAWSADEPVQLLGGPGTTQGCAP